MRFAKHAAALRPAALSGLICVGLSLSTLVACGNGSTSPLTNIRNQRLHHRFISSNNCDRCRKFWCQLYGVSRRAKWIQRFGESRDYRSACGCVNFSFISIQHGCWQQSKRELVHPGYSFTGRLQRDGEWNIGYAHALCLSCINCHLARLQHRLVPNRDHR